LAIDIFDVSVIFLAFYSMIILRIKKEETKFMAFFNWKIFIFKASAVELIQRELTLSAEL